MNPKKTEKQKQQEPKKKNIAGPGNAWKQAIGLVAIYLLALGLFIGAAFWVESSLTDVISHSVFVGMGFLLLIFLWSLALENGTLDYNNKKHMGRFWLFFFLAYGLAFLCVFLPQAGWPFLVIFVALSLYSNDIIGLTAGTMLLFVTVLLSGQGIIVFVLYFISGLCSICFFGTLKKNDKLGLPLFLSLLCLLLTQTAGVVLYTNEKLALEVFAVPFLNIIVSGILLLIFLKIFSATVLYQYREKYLEINDQEFPLLIALKNTAKDAYYQAVHTAYFCQRIGNQLQLHIDATKTAGYYHGIGILKGRNDWKTVSEICQEYGFPPESVEILQEFLDPKVPITKKETVVLLFSHEVITAILFLLEKAPDSPLDYDKIVDRVFKQKMENGILKDCDLTIQELYQMKKIFQEEKLYYDFLR